MNISLLKSTIYLFLLLFFSACFSPKVIPLKGNYSTISKSFSTTTTTDQVWDKLIDLFSQNGLSIKIIDRSSGLIVSERYQVFATTEFNNGILKDSTAYVVSPKVYNRNTKKYYSLHGKITAEWNVRIKTNEKGTLVSVNLVNIQGSSVVLRSGGRVDTEMIPCIECESTGVFEKKVFDIIK